MVVVKPRLQAGSVEEVPAGEPVHNGLRLEPGETDPAVRGPIGRCTPPPQGRAERDRPGPAAESVGEAGLGHPLGRRRRRRRRHAESEEVEYGAEELLEDGNGDSGVDKNEGEHALRWGRQARQPHGRRISSSEDSSSSRFGIKEDGWDPIGFDLRQKLDFMRKASILSDNLLRERSRKDSEPFKISYTC